MAEPISVMIVDDEILAIEDLQQLIPWEKYGFQIVATATNGQKALELYEKHLPQIIFADIRMPVMDGLEFSRRVMAYQNPVRIILLTVYKEFEYAKQAVEIGVSNYLLKHDINEENLVKELSKARGDLEREFHKNFSLRQQLIRKLFDGETIGDWRNFAGMELLLQKTDRLGLIFVQPDQPYFKEFPAPYCPLTEMRFDLKKIERPEGVQWVEGYDCNGGMAVLVGMGKTNSHWEERERLHQLALNISQRISPEDGESFSIIIVRGCTTIKELSLYLKKALTALDYLVFFGKDQILHVEDLPVQTGSHPPEMPSVIPNLANKIHNSDFDGINGLIDQAFQPVLAVKNPQEFKIICRQLLSLLDHYRREHELLSLQQLYEARLMDTKLLYYAPEILSWFKELFATSFKEAKEVRNDQYSRKVRQAMEYIRENYTKDLTVESIAASLGISGVYLSQLFKRETGQTVLEYLTAYRIKVAKNLLENGNYKIYEVAELVGYKTSQYFSRVFRKVAGTYPFGYKAKKEVRHEAGD